MKIAVTGPMGRLGSCLVGLGCIPLTCDITDREAIASSIAEADPHVIINAAGFTGVDASEEEANRDLATRVNTLGPGLLRQAFSGFFIHLSSGFVLDGESGPHAEDAVPNPVNFYGMTKLGGEMSARLRPNTAIVRTLDLYGPDTRSDFVRQIRDVLEMGQEKTLPSHLYGTPTYIPHLAQALLALAEKGPMDTILHVAGSATMSRYEWGRAIASAFGHDPNRIVPTHEITGKAPRPLRGGLLTTRAAAMGLPIYPPEKGLTDLAEWERQHAGSP